MWLLHTFSIGIYSILLWPVHIPLWCTGYLIRDKLPSPRAHRILLAVLGAGILFCEMLCQWLLTGFDRWGGIIAMAIIIDLVIGYFAKDVGRALRALVDWINNKTS